MKKVILLLGLSTFILLAGCFQRNKPPVVTIPDNRPVEVVTEKETGELFVFDEVTYDFGVLKQSEGKVQHTFSFTYNGKDPISVTSLPTSCACTAAEIDATQFSQGEKGNITITFNPNLHAEPEGRFFKSVLLVTEPALPEMPEVKIWAEIDLDLGEEAFELTNDDHDEEEEEQGMFAYTALTVDQFHNELSNKDFVLIKTDKSETSSIESTDYVIFYSEIGESEDILPNDKNAKIVVYSDDGTESRAASYLLVEHGYTNVYDLVGGKNAYDAFIEGIEE